MFWTIGEFSEFVMPRRPPPQPAPAGATTKLQYYVEGRRHLKAALKQFPAHGPEEALLKAQEAGGRLDPSTVAKYRGDLKRILMVILRLEGRRHDFECAWSRLDAALTKRKAKIPKQEQRTSALKLKDLTEEEAYELFCELKRHALLTRNIGVALAALYVLVAGHSGFRPIELVGARLNGTTLMLNNAKRQPGQSEERGIELKHLPDDVLTAMSLLLSITPPSMRRLEFRAWHKRLAEQLRRACVRIGIREVSPYSFRHIAIATWSRAGLSPSDIAKLAGHLSERTHYVHYARARVGHRRKAVARPMQNAVLVPKLDGLQQPAARAGVPIARQANGNSTAPPFEFEDMPATVIRKESPGRTPLSAEMITDAMRRWSGEGVSPHNPKIEAASERRLIPDQRPTSVLPPD